jgi:hypothetical protein
MLQVPGTKKVRESHWGVMTLVVTRSGPEVMVSVDKRGGRRPEAWRRAAWAPLPPSHPLACPQWVPLPSLHFSPGICTASGRGLCVCHRLKAPCLDFPTWFPGPSRVFFANGRCRHGPVSLRAVDCGSQASALSSSLGDIYPVDTKVRSFVGLPDNLVLTSFRS